MKEPTTVKAFAPYRNLVQNYKAAQQLTIIVTGLVVFGWLANILTSATDFRRPENYLLFALPALGGILLSVFLTIKYSMPRLVEIKPGRLCVYYMSKFHFIDQADLVEARRPNFFERLFLLKPQQAVVIRDSKKNRVVIQPQLYQYPANVNDALVTYLRPFLQTQSETNPSRIWRLPNFFWTWMASWSPVYLTGFLLYVVEKVNVQQAIQLALIGPVVVFALIMLARTRMIEFLDDRIRIRSLFKKREVPYAEISALNIPAWSELEQLFIETQWGYKLAAIDADLRNYPQIRDFLLLKCPSAAINGRLDPQMNQLCGFESPLDRLHAPPIAEGTPPPVTSRTQVWASHRQKVGGP